MTLAAQGDALIGVWFNGQKHQPDFALWSIDEDHPVLKTAMRQLTEYFAGKRDRFDVVLDLQSGTAFQQAVWQALRTITPGSTESYGDICRAIGKPNAARAVGAAIGRNPLSIVVPCHRVVGSTGALTGYAGGIERKVALLKLEQQAPKGNA
jgi:methylated-DNA-[protein]-cysteine S-methyltransferase